VEEVVDSRERSALSEEAERLALSHGIATSDTSFWAYHKSGSTIIMLASYTEFEERQYHTAFTKSNSNTARGVRRNLGVEEEEDDEEDEEDEDDEDYDDDDDDSEEDESKAPGVLRYAKDFLLSFAAHCTEKPPDFPDYLNLGKNEGPLKKDIPTTKRRRHGAGSGSGSKSSNANSNAKRTKKLDIRTQWETASTDDQRTVEDDTEELYRTSNAALNKLSIDNFEKMLMMLADLSPQIRTIPGLEIIVGLVFEKAVNGPRFSTMYADLCYQLQSNGVYAQFVTDEATGAFMDFRRLLLKRCQQEFEDQSKNRGKTTNFYL